MDTRLDLNKLVGLKAVSDDFELLRKIAYLRLQGRYAEAKIIDEKRDKNFGKIVAKIVSVEQEIETEEAVK